MHPADIQARLKKRGITQKDIAENLGVGQMVVSDVIRQRKASQRVMQAIANAVELPVEAVFAGYYAGITKRRSRQN